jgi:hypothetical protein
MPFVMRSFANFGTSEPWVARAWISVLEIHRFAFPAEEDSKLFTEKYAPIFENLHECFNEKTLLHRIIEEHQAKIESREIVDVQNAMLSIRKSIDVEMNQAVKDFFIKGNIAINHLYPLAKFLGHKITFLRRQKDADFEQKAAALLKVQPAALPLVELLRRHRNIWFKVFQDVRDRIEHESLPRLMVQYSLEAEGKVNAILPTIGGWPLIEITDRFWDNLFSFVEDVTVCLLSFKFPPNVKLVVIPKRDRDPEMPKKYKPVIDISGMQFQSPQPSQ